MKERFDIKFKKLTSKFNKDSKIKECFHFNSEQCSKDIISAHSIQRGKILTLLEENINGNSTVYSFLHLKFDDNGRPVGFDPLGKKTASTFYGFCGYHDTEIFKSIENNDVDLNNDEHCFLLSYRAFAKDYHAKKETLQGYKNNLFYRMPGLKDIRQGMINGSELGLRDADFVKNRLNELLKDKNYGELEFLTYKLDYMVPIALAASFNPDYSYKNELLNLSGDSSIEYEFVNFIIQPTLSGETLILLSCLPEQKKSVKFIDQLYQLKPLLFEKAISSLAIAYVENTFVSPSIWGRLSLLEREQLLSELFLTSPQSRSTLVGFFHSKLNLLDRKFRKANSNIS
uniref:hypothetical protein n=1 Tax=Fulvivirga sp. TaxID=1931237 RepID=UPI00404A02F4